MTTASERRMWRRYNIHMQAIVTKVVRSNFTSRHFTRNNGGRSDFARGHLKVAYLVTRPMNASEAGGDLALTQTSLLLSLIAPFDNMRTLKFTAQPKNAFLATVNQMFGDSSQPPTTAEHSSLSELCSTI